MKKISQFFSIVLSIAILIYTTPATAGQSIPPSARLSYTVSAQYNGMSLSGEALIDWRATKSAYSIQNTANLTFLGRVLQASSYGSVNAGVLHPKNYTEKRIRKDTTTTQFNYNKHTISLPNGKQISFSGNVQDRSSIVWQLASKAMANPKQAPHARWSFAVSGKSHIKTMTFVSNGTQNISTPLGTFTAVRFSEINDKEHTMHVWLAPSYHWYPIRLYFVEKGSLEINQTIQAIND